MSTKKEGVQTLLDVPYVVAMRLTHIPQVADLLCVKQCEFYVSVRNKMSSKRPSGLRLANQDKKFRGLHKWHLKPCFLRVLRKGTNQVASEVSSLGSD